MDEIKPIQQLDICLLYSPKFKHLALICQIMQCSVYSFDSKLQKNMILSNVIHSFMVGWLSCQMFIMRCLWHRLFFFVHENKKICTHVRSCKIVLLLGTTKLLDNLSKMNLVISKCPCVFCRPSGYFVIYSLNKNHTYILYVKNFLSQMYIAI